MTLGGEGALAYDGRELYRSRGYQVSVVNRLGAGDSFDSGMLYGYIHSGIQAGLNYGSAISALKMTIPQNTPILNREDVESLLANRSLEIVR
jgi:2-dehydro-3-deoxygluconokinase